MKAYLPSQFLQVALHQKRGQPNRLDELLNLLEQCAFVPVVGIDLLSISESGLLLLPTRQFWSPFSRNALDFIVDFVSRGNPLFHLSNHPPLTIQDTRLGRRFGYHFRGVVFGADIGREFQVYPLPHAIFDADQPSLHFSVRNSCTISCGDAFSPIADFSKSSLLCGNPSSAFGIARPRSAAGGAIVALGDSGILGEPSPNHPGPGLDAGDNRQLVERILRWLRDQAA